MISHLSSMSLHPLRVEWSHLGVAMSAPVERLIAAVADTDVALTVASMRLMRGGTCECRRRPYLPMAVVATVRRRLLTAADGASLVRIARDEVREVVDLDFWWDPHHSLSPVGRAVRRVERARREFLEALDRERAEVECLLLLCAPGSGSAIAGMPRDAILHEILPALSPIHHERAGSGG